MLRLALGLLAFVFLTVPSTAADGTSYLDPMGRFKLVVPNGWESGRPNNDVFALVMATKSDQASGFCLVMVREIAETRNISQAELDAAFSSTVNREFWEKAFAVGGMKDVSIEDSGTTDRNGLKTYYVVATLQVQGEEGKIAATGKQVMYVIPGSLQFVNCSSKKETFAAISKQFEAIFDSYEPLAGVIASAEKSSPSLLTLFADAQFSGTARVLAQNTPNVPALGTPTGSLAVAGFGQWEVCDGVNYTGTCRVLGLGEAGQRGRTVPVGSVRRIVSQDVRNAAGVISTATGLALKETSEHVARQR